MSRMETNDPEKVKQPNSEEDDVVEVLEKTRKLLEVKFTTSVNE